MLNIIGWIVAGLLVLIILLLLAGRKQRSGQGGVVDSIGQGVENVLDGLGESFSQSQGGSGWQEQERPVYSKPAPKMLIKKPRPPTPPIKINKKVDSSGAPLLSKNSDVKRLTNSKE